MASFPMKTVFVSTVALAVVFGMGPVLGAQSNLPEGAVAGFGDIPFAGGSRIGAYELSPNGKLLATLSLRSATVWNAATGQPVHRFYFDIPAYPCFQRRLAFSPDSKRLACGPSNQFVVVWDLASGKELRRFDTAAEPLANLFLSFSADGAAIILESKGVLTWFSIENGAAMRHIRQGKIAKLSPDEKTFVAVKEAQEEVLIGDIVTGKITHTLPIAARSDAASQGVLFLPDGVSLAVVCHEGLSVRELQFWDFKTGKRQDRTWPLTKSPIGDAYRLALSPDGKILYMPQYRKGIRRYSLVTNEEHDPTKLFGQYVWNITAHSDGRTLFAADFNKIRRWDAIAGKEISKDSDFVDWNAMAVSSNGRWLARSGRQLGARFLELCDLESRQTKRIDLRSEAFDNSFTPSEVYGILAFTPDCRTLAINRYSCIQLFSVPEMKEGKRLALPDGRLFREMPISLSKDGRFVAARSQKDSLHIFELANDKNILTLPKVGRMCVTPDGEKLLTVSTEDQSLRFYDMATQKVLFEREAPTAPNPYMRGNRGFVSAMAFSPDGGLCALAMVGGQVVLLDVATGKERSHFSPLADPQSPNGYHLNHNAVLAFSADGQWLAVSGTDGYVRIWDVNSRRQLHRLHGHDDVTHLLAFSADSRQLLSFGDNEGFLWDLHPRKTDKATDPFGDLGSVDGPTAYRAMWALADDPKGPAILRRLILPKRVDARPERIARLIGELDAEAFKVRDAAMKSLADLEGCARPALTELLKANPSLELKRRIETLLDDPLPELSRQASRAVRAMELSGSDDARTLLREWSSGTPGTRLTDEAAAALARHRLKTIPND